MHCLLSKYIIASCTICLHNARQPCCCQSAWQWSCYLLVVSWNMCMRVTSIGMLPLNTQMVTELKALLPGRQAVTGLCCMSQLPCGFSYFKRMLPSLMCERIPLKLVLPAFQLIIRGSYLQARSCSAQTHTHAMLVPLASLHLASATLMLASSWVLASC